MANAIEYALMAGRVYQTTRGEINWLPDLLSQGCAIGVSITILFEPPCHVAHALN